MQIRNIQRKTNTFINLYPHRRERTGKQEKLRRLKKSQNISKVFVLVGSKDYKNLSELKNKDFI